MGCRTTSLITGKTNTARIHNIGIKIDISSSIRVSFRTRRRSSNLPLATVDYEVSNCPQAVKPSKISQGRAAANRPDLTAEMFSKIRSMYKQDHEESDDDLEREVPRLLTAEPEASQVYDFDEVGFDPEGMIAAQMSYKNDTSRSNATVPSEKAAFWVTVRLIASLLTLFPCFVVLLSLGTTPESFCVGANMLAPS